MATRKGHREFHCVCRDWGTSCGRWPHRLHNCASRCRLYRPPRHDDATKSRNLQKRTLFKCKNGTH